MRGNDHGECLAEETLTEYLEGVLDPVLKAASEVHLISCDDCRGRLGFFMRLLGEEVGAEESQAVQVIGNAWDQKKHRELPRSTGTFPAWFLGFLGVAAVLLIGVVSTRYIMDRRAEPQSASEVVQLLLQQQRPFESRLTDEPHLSIVRTRGVEEPGVSYPLVAAEMTKLGADPHEWGRLHLLQKEFSKAIQYLEIAAVEPGATAGVHNDLGVAYMESGDPAKVEKSGGEFRHAIDLDPSFAPAVFNLALSYERANAPAEAAAQWKRYLEMDSKSEWASEARERLKGLSR
ncbi:MAG TPA: hypothetical protein VKY31_13335 [Terriglobia bacterium]|nr:hypothetical protein [Terriglobia bacterium]